MKKLKVIELFAGVGGFRLGLEGWNGKKATSNYKESFDSPYEIIWSNQWEPSTKIQHASLIYEKRWGKTGHNNTDINSVDINSIPDHDVLVGGFPCQDYSVATTLKNSQGLLGKKGVLWWSIHKIIREKVHRPKYLILENVDRLLTSPSKQRGRDFAIILKSLCDLGYDVEWKVINAAEYGMPQRRKRTFILAYQHCSAISQELRSTDGFDWICNSGVFAKAFPNNKSGKKRDFAIEGNMVVISNDFNKNNSKEIFYNHGVLVGDTVKTMELDGLFDGPSMTLGQILQKEQIDDVFWINDSEYEKWKYLKGAKKESRITPDGFEYEYSEGSMTFPDALDKPSRTIITGEGGRAPSRFKHVITDQNRLRRLTPVELERLNMFPDDHTLLGGVSETKRAFLMGNALVVGVVEKIGEMLNEFIKKGT